MTAKGDQLVWRFPLLRKLKEAGGTGSPGELHLLDVAFRGTAADPCGLVVLSTNSAGASEFDTVSLITLVATMLMLRLTHTVINYADAFSM